MTQVMSSCGLSGINSPTSSLCLPNLFLLSHHATHCHHRHVLKRSLEAVKGGTHSVVRIYYRRKGGPCQEIWSVFTCLSCRSSPYVNCAVDHLSCSARPSSASKEAQMHEKGPRCQPGALPHQGMRRPSLTPPGRPPVEGTSSSLNSSRSVKKSRIASLYVSCFRSGSSADTPVVEDINP